MRRLTLFLLTLLLSSGLPVAGSAQDAKEQDLYAAATAYANLVLVTKDYEAAAAQSHPSVAAQMTASMLEDATGQVLAQTGPLHSLEPKRQSLLQGFNAVVLTGTFDVGDLDVVVVMDDDHAVAGILVRPPS